MNKGLKKVLDFFNENLLKNPSSSPENDFDQYISLKDLSPEVLDEKVLDAACYRLAGQLNQTMGEIMYKNYLEEEKKMSKNSPSN